MFIVLLINDIERVSSVVTNAALWKIYLWIILLSGPRITNGIDKSRIFGCWYKVYLMKVDKGNGHQFFAIYEFMLYNLHYIRIRKL